VKITNKVKTLGLLISAVLFLSACGVSSSDSSTTSDDSDNDSSNTETVITTPSTFTINDGRTLGSQCAQCHGTNGISINKWDSIAGEDDLVDEVYEHNDPIMDAQMKGYTISEIQSIQTWLSTVKGGDDD